MVHGFFLLLCIPLHSINHNLIIRQLFNLKPEKFHFFSQMRLNIHHMIKKTIAMKQQRRWKKEATPRTEWLQFYSKTKGWPHNCQTFFPMKEKIWKRFDEGKKLTEVLSFYLRETRSQTADERNGLHWSFRMKKCLNYRSKCNGVIYCCCTQNI